MRDAFAVPNSSRPEVPFLSAGAILAYRSAKVMRALSAYLFATIFVALSPVAQAAPTTAEQFVQQHLDKGYSILNDASLSVPERGEKFRAMLGNTMDTKRVALFTLGVYARSADSQQIDQYTSAFTGLVTAVLQHDLAGDPGETVTVTGSIVRAPDDVIVTAKLNGSSRANGQPVNLGFRLRVNSAGEYVLVDLLVEGVSMAMAQRSDYTAWLQQHHGDIAALTSELQLRAKAFREQDMAAQAAKTVLSK